LSQGTIASGQQSNAPAPAPAAQHNNRASTIAKYASTFWMMVSRGTPRSGGTSARQPQVWVWM